MFSFDDVPGGLRDACQGLLEHDREVPQSGDAVLSLDTLSDLSCLKETAAVRARVLEATRNKRIFVPMCTILERIAGIAMHRAVDATRADMIARVMQQHIQTLNPRLILEDSGYEFQRSVVAIEKRVRTGDLRLPGKGRISGTGARVKVGVHAHVHNMHVISSATTFYRELRRTLPFLLILSPTTGETL